MEITLEKKLKIAVSVLKEIGKTHTFFYDEYGKRVHDSDCKGCKANRALRKMKEDKD
jgi:hypothetical protein